MIRQQMQRSRLTPWIGLVVPPVAWAVHHQAGSNLVFYDCRLGDSGVITALGVVMGLIALAAGWISWVSRRDGATTEVRTFAAYIGALSGGIFFLALAFQTLATLLLPPCHS
ncbi:MAG TPA: hypothetical protein VFN88_12215 [Caulobacteraceae bacterium]|nr:hypothetical protein [Caulobacteraceae bacterium]